MEVKLLKVLEMDPAGVVSFLLLDSSSERGCLFVIATPIHRGKQSQGLPRLRLAMTQENF